MSTVHAFWAGPSLWALPNLDAPPPAPWGGHGMPQPRDQADDEPRPEEERPPVQEPWAGPLQPVRDPGQATHRWRLH